MVDFVADGQPFEMPLAAANEGYAATPPSFGQFMGAGSLSTTRLFMDASERGAYQGSSWLDQAVYGIGAGQAPAEAGVPEAGSVPTPMLSAEEANAKYAPMGADGKPARITDAPMPDAVAQLVGEEKADQIERDGVMARFANAHSGPVNFAAGTAAFLADPLNLATAFVPGFGEEAVTAGLGGGLFARLAGRAVSGATAGAASQAPITALRYTLGNEEAQDYSLRDAFRDMLYSAAGNALFSTGLGAAGEMVGRRAPAPIDAATQHDAMSAAVGQIVDGRPVDVSPVFAAKGEQVDPIFQGSARRPEDIIDFLMSRGGLQDDGGELRAMDLNRAQKGRFGTLARQSGEPFDRARVAAEEAGFLPDGSTINDLLDAIRETQAGNPRFRPEDADEWRQFQDQRRNWSPPEEADPWNPNNLFSDFAEDQSRLYREGYAPGVPQGDFDAVHASIYGDDAIGAREATQNDASFEGEKINTPPAFTAEERAAMTEPERAELDGADQRVADANDHAAMYDEAGACLGGG